MKREAQRGGYDRPALLRPLGDNLRDDLKGALGVLAGVALFVLVFGGDVGLLAAAIGLTAFVVGRAVHRRLKRAPVRGRAHGD